MPMLDARVAITPSTGLKLAEIGVLLIVIAECGLLQRKFQPCGSIGLERSLLAQLLRRPACCSSLPSTGAISVSFRSRTPLAHGGGALSLLSRPILRWRERSDPGTCICSPTGSALPNITGPPSESPETPGRSRLTRRPYRRCLGAVRIRIICSAVHLTVGG